MKRNKRLYISIFWIILGIVISILQFDPSHDEYWSGIGIALIAVGAVQIIKNIKYHTNQDYKEKIDTQNSDERNRFISTKAWAWAGYLYILLAAVAIIVLQIMGLKDISHFISMTMCALLTLYWICYLFLRNKY